MNTLIVVLLLAPAVIGGLFVFWVIVSGVAGTVLMQGLRGKELSELEELRCKLMYANYAGWKEIPRILFDTWRLWRVTKVLNEEYERRQR